MKPPVPAKDEKPVMGLVTTKNFVATNALEVMLSSSKRAAAARGQEEMNWTLKPDFGKVGQGGWVCRSQVKGVMGGHELTSIGAEYGQAVGTATTTTTTANITTDHSADALYAGGPTPWRRRLPT